MRLVETHEAGQGISEMFRPIRQASGKAVQEVADLDAGAGVEGHLLAYVAAGLGAAEVAHEVDDAGEVVGLEGQHPLVVTEGE
jgi:hypothetical protein